MSSAPELLAGRLDAGSRVLLLGAGGWFGSTFLDLVERSGCGARVLPLTGRPRSSRVGGREWELQGWDARRVADFEPTLVVNCAFLTRERLPQLGFDRYVGENVRLTGRFLRTLALPSVRAAVTVSSGAAVADGGVPEAETNPYGYLKWSEELVGRAFAAERGLALVVCRAWSVSGGFVNRPHDYAFSDLVLQALHGRLEVRSAHEVWRRYVGADDLLAVCSALALDGWSGTVDSGGPLVEMGELAAAIAGELAPGAPVGRPEASDGTAPDRYHSDDRSWQEACARLGHRPAPLEEQIRAVAAGLGGAA